MTNMLNPKGEQTKEMRLRHVRITLHKKVEKYMAQVHAREDRKLTKENACIEILEKGTRKIKVA